MNLHFPTLSAIVLLVLAPSGFAAVDMATQSSAGAAYSGTAWAGTISPTDLINAGQSTLSSVTVSSTHAAFPAPGLNDGTTVDFGVPGGNTFFMRTANFAQPGSTAVATFDLNTAVNTFGYDITSIQSFMGWDTVSMVQANQTYTVAVHAVGAPAGTYLNIATVAYTPFADVNGTKYESRVVITENSTGVLATGVDSIRFTFLDPLLSVTPGGGGTEGTLVRELDVFGTPTTGGNHAPVASDGATTITDNTVGGTPVATVNATDQDQGDTLSFAITAGNTGDAFAIHPATGVIRVAGTLDAQTTNSYDLLVTVTDNGGLSDTATIRVTVIPATVQVATESSAGTPFASTAWASSLSTTDLINAGQATLSAATVSTSLFGPAGINDGASTYNSTTDNTFFSVPSQFPATATFVLDTTAYPNGFRINSITSFMGWHANSATHGNQTYTVAVRPVGSSTFTTIAVINYAPFGTANSADHESHVTISDNSGTLATGVEAIRFTFSAPEAGGSSPGTVVREIDVFGTPVGSGPPATVAVASPKARQVIQRGTANTASVAVSGSYTGTPDSIEARMVVMAGAGNSGTGTDWATLVATPAGGTYAGTLAGIAAGGWYQIEVRAVTGGTPGTATVIQRVGIGDIYITCGQSNSANHGAPAGTVTDDRVSAWNYSGGVWTKAADPMPGASGGGGSVWPRLGDLLAARDNVPIAFACLGQGSTTVAQWTPADNVHYPKVRTAVQAFPANGFRAALWHQGESDSLASTTPANYQSRMQSIVTQSRVDAGWTVPWYLAEVGFHPSSTLAQEEPVVAGQRRAIHADAQVFPGPVTDDFHLESKVSDTVHFNAAGLADHAAQWAEVLGGTPPLAPKNGDFESNTALADGGIAVINTGATTSPSVIGWRALAASGEAVADGSCGYYNPNDSFYPGAADGGGGAGVLPNMSGRHVAFLSGSTAGAHFLQTRRAMLGATRTYTLTVALGVRGTADTFGGAVLDILADGVVIGSRTVTLADLNALNAGNATGKFTDIAVKASTGFSVIAGKPLAVRITKTGGTGTYLDFDQVRLTSALTPYTAWADSFPGLTDKTPEDDPDGDGIKNLVEYVIGGDPRVSSTEFLPNQRIVGTDLVLTYQRNDVSESDTTQTGQWSANLTGWTDTAPVLINENGTDPDDMKLVIPITHAVNGKLFGRFKVSQP